MSEDKAINQAIAEACEWAPEGCRCPHCRAHIPNYCNDLNAMHEAEKVLGDELKSLYELNLARVVRHDQGISDIRSIRHSKFTTFATAAQRAEAFLKTLNLWK